MNDVSEKGEKKAVIKNGECGREQTVSNSGGVEFRLEGGSDYQSMFGGTMSLSRRAFDILASRGVALLLSLVLPQPLCAVTIYRIELAGGGTVFAEDEPKLNGINFVFRSSPQGTLLALRRSEVATIQRIEADNKPEADFANATLKKIATTRPTPHRDPRALTGQPIDDDPGPRRYLPGDDQPGNRVAFPVSRDDLLPGDYRPFPAGPGGQSGDAPLIKEGPGTPKAGALREPPHALQFPNPPASPNIQVLAVPLNYSEKPHIDGTQPPKE